MSDYTEILSLYIKSKKNILIFIKNIMKVPEDKRNILFYEVCMDLKNNKKQSDVLYKIKNEKYLWNDTIFAPIKDNIEEKENFIVCPFEVAEGALECNKCGSKKTFSYSKQTRSGDESTTVFATCVECRASWKI